MVVHCTFTDLGGRLVTLAVKLNSDGRKNGVGSEPFGMPSLSESITELCAKAVFTVLV